MSSISDIIKGRRSISRFKNDPVSLDLLKELLNVAVWAPNRRQREPWRFIAVHGTARTGLAEAAIASLPEEGREKQADKLLMTIGTNVPLSLVVVCPESEQRLVRDEDYAGACCAVQNLQLAAWERGLGMIWKTNDYMYEEPFRDHLGVQAGERIVAMLQIGYPELVPNPIPRTPAEQKLTVMGN